MKCLLSSHWWLHSIECWQNLKNTYYVKVAWGLFDKASSGICFYVVYVYSSIICNPCRGMLCTSQKIVTMQRRPTGPTHVSFLKWILLKFWYNLNVNGTAWSHSVAKNTKMNLGPLAIVGYVSKIVCIVCWIFEQWGRQPLCFIPVTLKGIKPFRRQTWGTCPIFGLQPCQGGWFSQKSNNLYSKCLSVSKQKAWFTSIEESRFIHGASILGPCI